MQYLGGKSRIAKQIARVIADLRQPDQLYIEPFIGSCSVFHLIPEPKIGFDAHRDLILMWRAVQEGWVPPESLSEQEYNALRDSPSSPLRGFAGFGCSFGGKWFGGYARNRRGDNYCRQAKNSVLVKRAGLSGAVLGRCDYRSVASPPGSIVYCDPPYAGTTSYSLYVDHGDFWRWVREQSRESTVLVSEYEAPSDFRVVAEYFPVKNMSNNNGGGRAETEKIFTLR
jgi:DNA adenine methylase